MFQKVKFKEQLQKLIGNSTTTEFSERTGFNRTYLSKYLNLRMDRRHLPIFFAPLPALRCLMKN